MGSLPSLGDGGDTDTKSIKEVLQVIDLIIDTSGIQRHTQRETWWSSNRSISVNIKAFWCVCV